MIFRAFITRLVEMAGGRVYSPDSLGRHDEVFDAEVFETYGFSANPTDGGETLGFEIEGDADHRVLLPPRGDEHGRAEVGTTKIYYGENTHIVLSEDKIIITRGDYNATIEGDTLTTNLNVHTSANLKVDGNVEIGGNVEVSGKVDVEGDVTSNGEVRAGSVKLSDHKHTGVTSGNSITQGPV